VWQLNNKEEQISGNKALPLDPRCFPSLFFDYQISELEETRVKREEKKTPPTGPPPLLPLQEQGGATCSGVPQFKLPLPLEGKPFYCAPLR